MPSSRHTSFPNTARPHLLNAGALIPALQLNFSLKTNSTTLVLSLLGHLLPIRLNCRMAIARALPQTAPAMAPPLLMTDSIPIADRITARRPRRHLLTNLLLVIGVNRLFNPRMHVLMRPVRPRQSTRLGAVLDNVLPVYKVPQIAPRDRPIISLAIALLLAVYVVGTGHHNNSRRTRLQPPRAEMVATSLPPLRHRTHLLHVPITAILRPHPPLLPPLVFLNPVRRSYTHQCHVQPGLRHCHKACQQRRSVCHVMIANCSSSSPALQPFVVAESKVDYVASSPSMLPKR